MSGISITCGYCGHTGPYEGFCSTPVGGELPKSTFQCPHCKRAWKRKMKSFVRAGDIIIGAGYDIVPETSKL